MSKSPAGRQMGTRNNRGLLTTTVSCSERTAKTPCCRSGCSCSSIKAQPKRPPAARLATAT
eukprot:11190483-Lingulodinium_polyedra.AAC.1